MKFSQRTGITPTTKLAQKDSIDKDLRNGLWNVLTIFYWKEYHYQQSGYGFSEYVSGSNLEDLIANLWLRYFKLPIDEILDKHWKDCLETIRRFFYQAKWYEVYDFIEFMSMFNGPRLSKEQFIKSCNSHLEKENSAWRFVGNKITEITSQVEIDEVEKALEISGPYAGARTHLATSLSLLSDKFKPDYRNSIKESISAVEALAKKITNSDSATLGKALTVLEQKHALHPALRKAFSSLYGYTSSTNGIRHALLDEDNLTKSDARFMLVCCSAFINYIVESMDV